MKKYSKLVLIISLLLLISLLVSCVSIPVGNGEKIKISKKGVSHEDKEGKKTDIKLDKKQGDLTLSSTDSEGKNVDFQIKADNKLPEEMPKDIPIPKEAEILGTSKMVIDKSLIIQVNFQIGKTKDLDKYKKIYEDYLEKAGYESKMELMQDGFVQLSSGKEGEDGEEVLHITLTLDEENIIGSISYSKNKPDN